VVTFTHRAPGTNAEDWASHVRARGLPALQLDPEVARLVVLAAHPDDESLGAGGSWPTLTNAASRSSWWWRPTVSQAIRGRRPTPQLA
jgi:hypothetical protein